MNRPTKLALFALVCLAQLWAAGSGIARYERALNEGVVYRFESAPVDPEDPFRGRYVQLRFAVEESHLLLPDEDWGARRVYAVLGVDARGFAEFTKLLDEAPAEGSYLYVEAMKDGSGTRLRLPFDRYFLEESKAARVEQLYREATRAGEDDVDAYVEVRVLDGLGVIAGLLIEGEDVSARLGQSRDDSPEGPARPER